MTKLTKMDIIKEFNKEFPRITEKHFKDENVYLTEPERKVVETFILKALKTQRESIIKEIENEIKEETNLEVLTGLSVALGILTK